MTFSTLTFLVIFVPILLALYFCTPRKWIGVRNTILLLASLLFYGWGEPANVFLILLCVSLTYLSSFAVVKRRKWGLIMGVMVNLLPLLVFKYADFILLNINGLFGLSVSPTGLILPVGISFYTFQVLTYVIDLYRGQVGLQRNPAYLTLYVFFFPQLIAGPIVRYSDVEKEIQNRSVSLEDLKAGSRRFMIGLAKKILLANQAGFVATTIQAQPQNAVGAGLLWISVIAFGVQIYFDFSGYSDMAIGLGRIFGFHFLENFDKPYISRSITEFWRRWHMSLSTFFRDYIYIPMGGNCVIKDETAPNGKRVLVARHIRNLLVVWALTGLWHGASWNFVIWGLYYFVLLVLEKYVYGKWLDKLPQAAARLITWFLYTVGWAIFMFETNSITALGQYILRLFEFYPAQASLGVRALAIQGNVLVVAVGMIISMIQKPKFVLRLEGKAKAAAAAIEDVLLLAAFVFSILFIIGESFNPFIYYRF